MTIAAIPRVVGVLETGPDNQRSVVAGRFEQGTEALPQIVPPVAKKNTAQAQD